jgi:hypothetical protein
MNPRSSETSPPGHASDDLLRDQRSRWRRGDCVDVESILRLEPQLRLRAEAVLDLIYHEVILREERGDTPAPEEYVRRFPELTREIRAQFEVHRAFGFGARSMPLIPETDDPRASSRCSGRRASRMQPPRRLIDWFRVRSRRWPR